MPDVTRRRAVAAGLAAVLAAIGTTDVAVPTDERGAELGGLERVRARPCIAIIGASASAGFGVFVEGPGGDGPGIVDLRLRDLLEAVVEPCPVTFSDWSTAMFFRDPIDVGRESVERAMAVEPAAVLAIDYLFWFAYGSHDAEGRPIREESQREALFEIGLANLDRLSAPILVGDLPNAKGASTRILSERQIPAPETLARLNARLEAFAAERPRIRVLRLSEEMRRAKELDAARPPPAVGDDGTPVPSIRRPRLQRDRMHPTFDGLVEIARASLLAMREVPAMGTLATEVDDVELEDLRSRIQSRVLNGSAAGVAP